MCAGASFHAAQRKLWQVQMRHPPGNAVEDSEKLNQGHPVLLALEVGPEIAQLSVFKHKHEVRKADCEAVQS